MKHFLTVLAVLGLFLLFLVIILGLPALAYFVIIWVGGPKWAALSLAILVFVITGVSVNNKK